MCGYVNEVWLSLVSVASWKLWTATSESQISPVLLSREAVAAIQRKQLGREVVKVDAEL